MSIQQASKDSISSWKLKEEEWQVKVQEMSVKLSSSQETCQELKSLNCDLNSKVEAMNACLEKFNADLEIERNNKIDLETKCEDQHKQIVNLSISLETLRSRIGNWSFGNWKTAVKSKFYL